MEVVSLYNFLGLPLAFVFLACFLTSCALLLLFSETKSLQDDMILIFVALNGSDMQLSIHYERNSDGSY